MGSKNILITGLPGVGKTTLIKKLSGALKSLRPAGFYTEEIREGGQRKGFELISLEGKRGLLSHKQIDSLYRVGPYCVDVKGFEDFLRSVSFSDPFTRLIIIDEVGKMECLSDQFKELLNATLDSEKWVIATVALKGSGLTAKVKKRQDIKLFEITPKNRDALFSEILKEVETGADGGSEERIDVIAYSGYRGEESPRAFLFRGVKVEVIEILNQWIEEGSRDRSRRRFFKIEGSDGASHVIYYDDQSMEWFHIV